MALPTSLVCEVDFTGFPTAGYYDQISNADNLVSYWRMNSASVLTDVLAANNGIIEGTPTLGSGALPHDTDQALTFNGSSNDAYVLDAASLSPTSFSLEGWVNVAAYPGATRDLAAKRGSYLLQITSTGVLQFTVKKDTTVATASSYAPITKSAWHHVVCTYDTANVKLYVDGMLNSTAALAPAIEVTTQPLRFAASRGTTAPVWQSSVTGTVSGTNLVINAPASIATGDLLLAHVCSAEDTATLTPPAGWVLLANVGALNARTRVYYKIATSSEPASYTFTNSIGGINHGAISRFTGVDSITPLANPAYTGTATNGAPSTGTHLPNLDNTMIVALFGGRTNGAWTESSGTERYDFNGGAGTTAIAMSTQTQASAASLSVTGTQTGGDRTQAVMVILGGTGLNYLACSLDDFSFWNVALTANQVASHYQAQFGDVGSWKDISADVTGASIRSGRQYELDQIQASSADVPLNDLKRNYDPTNTSGANYPNVKTTRRIRLRASANSSYGLGPFGAGSYGGPSGYPLFRGFVERWPSVWKDPNYAGVKLTATDGFRPLGLAGISGSLPAQLSGARINAVLNKARWPVADRAIDTGQFTMAAAALGAGSLAFAHIQEIADSELGIFFIDAAGVATFHDSAHRWTATRSVTSQATFADDGTFIPYTDLVPSEDDDHLANDWQVTTAGGVMQEATDQTSVAEHFPVTQARSTFLDNPGDATTQSGFLLQRTANPAYRFDQLVVTLAANTPGATWQTVLGLMISDRVTVIRTPVRSVGGSTIRKDCFIEASSWAISPDQWKVTFQLSPVATDSYRNTIVRDVPVSYWRLDAVA